MVVKTITITEHAYEMLKRLKNKDESFSDVITRVAKNRSELGKFFGLLPKEGATSARLNATRARKELGESIEARKHVHS